MHMFAYQYGDCHVSCGVKKAAYTRIQILGIFISEGLKGLLWEIFSTDLPSTVIFSYYMLDAHKNSCNVDMFLLYDLWVNCSSRTRCFGVSFMCHLFSLQC